MGDFSEVLITPKNIIYIAKIIADASTLILFREAQEQKMQSEALVGKKYCFLNHFSF